MFFRHALVYLLKYEKIPSIAPSAEVGVGSVTSPLPICHCRQPRLLHMFRFHRGLMLACDLDHPRTTHLMGGGGCAAGDEKTTNQPAWHAAPGLCVFFSGIVSFPISTTPAV